MEENMIRVFATVQSQLPKTELKMINYLKNNHSITNMGYLAPQITYKEKELAIAKFARYLTVGNGINNIKRKIKNNNPTLENAFKETKRKIITLTAQSQREQMPKHDPNKIARWIENNARLHPSNDTLANIGYKKKDFFLLFANWWIDNKTKTISNDKINNEVHHLPKAAAAARMSSNEEKTNISGVGGDANLRAFKVCNFV